MKFIDLDSQYKLIKKNIHSNILKTITHKKFILGPEIDILEKKLSNFTDSNYCITTSSGTDALLISLISLNIGPGDEVITSAFSYISSIEMIVLLGAKPVLVDVERETANIDYRLIEKKITNRTKAIIAVSLYGNPADFYEINKISNKYNIKVIEDAAQSFGSSYYGKKSCNLSHIGCTSFFPSKVLSCYGDGGAIFTNSKKIYELAKRIRIHGQSKKYYHDKVGILGRLDTIQASILLSKIKIFNLELKKRNKIAKQYINSLNRRFFSNKISIITTKKNRKSNNSIFTLVVRNRKKLIERFKQQSIPFNIYYPMSFNQQFAYKKYFNNQNFVNSEYLSKHVFSIPIHPYLLKSHQEKIIKTIINILN